MSNAVFFNGADGHAASFGDATPMAIGGTTGEDASIVMTWPDSTLPGGQAVRVLGEPTAEVIDHDGVYLARRELTKAERETLGLPPVGPDPPF